MNRDPALLDIQNTPIDTWINRYALAVLYYATNGPEWIFNEGFLGELSVCDWFGIACNEFGSVMRVSLGK